MPAHAQTRYAAGLEKMSILDVPATFGEVAKNEWAKALNEWVKFGDLRVRGLQRRQEAEGPHRRRHQPRAVQAALSENQKYWTDPLGATR